MRNGIGNVVNRTMKRNNNKETAPDPAASTATSQTATSATGPQQAPPKQQQQQAPDKDSKDKNGVGARKTKPTHEEATLTAKNYRLAKELSELRVRHREECKNVTKLTMENMNLASRCREAISSVAMLKKELTAQQRRTAEAVALQQQQQRQSELVKSVIVNAAAASAAAAANSNSPANTTKIAVADALAAVPSSPAVESNKVAATTPTATPTNGKSPANKQPVSVNASASPAAHGGVAVPTANGTVIGSSSKRNLTVDVEAEMEFMDLIVAAHTPTTSANSSPIPPQYGHARPAPALTSVHDNAGTNTNSSINAKQTNDNDDDDDDQDTAMMGADTISSIKSVKIGSATSSPYYTPPESPAKRSIREEEAGVTDDDDYSEPDVEVYQELKEQHFTDSKKSPTLVTSIVAGRQDLRKSTPPPIIDSAAEMRCDSPGQSCGTGYAGVIKKENYNEEYPGDISVVRQQSGRRRPSKLDGLESLGDFKEVDDETSGNSGTSTQVAAAFERKQAAADDKSTMSSIDAFEASFKTDFSESFSPRDATVEEKKTSESGIYNPFFPSPAKKSPRESASTSTSDRPWANNTRDRSSVASRRMEHRRNAGGASANGNKLPSPKASTPPASPAASGKLAAAVDPSPKAPFSVSVSTAAKRFPSPSGASSIPIAQPSSPAIQHYSPRTTQEKRSPRNAARAFLTPPPLEGSRTPSPERTKSSEQPSRPEKTGYDAARSRYEKALKPRDPGHKFKEPDELFKLSSTEPTAATLPNAMVTNAVVSEAVVPHLVVTNPVVSDAVASHLVVTNPVVSDAVVSHLVVTNPVVTNATVPNVMVSNEQPSVRDRAAIFSDTSPRTQDKPVVFRGSWVAQTAEEKKQPASPLPSSPIDDGDIPMNSTLSAKKPERRSRAASSSPVRDMGYGSDHSGSASVNEIGEARTRLRPWDSASASSAQLNEEREFNQSQIDATSSPIGASRFTLSGKQSRTVKDLPPEEYQHVSVRYRRGEAYRPKTDAAGIGPR